MEVAILLEGFLEKCSSASEQGKRDWKKRYFVYKHFTASNIKCLEYYKDRNWRKQDPKGVLTLYPGYDVVKVHDQKRRFVFDIKTVEHTFRLSAYSEDEENRWILLLEKENIVKSFPVEPVLDDKMHKIGANGMCQLHIADTEIRLVSVHDGHQLMAWPFTCLRRYMCSRGKFTIEAGRRAPTGEGKFSFVTAQHDEIYKLLDTVIKSRAAKEGAGSQEITPTRINTLEAHNTISTKNENRYDHLQSSPSPNPPHPTHPNYDQNIMPSHKLVERRQLGDYAAPYGHVKPRESITSFGSTHTEPDNLNMGNINGYNALDHENIPHEVGSIDGYNTLSPMCVPGRRQPPPVPTPSTTDRDLYNIIGETPQGGTLVHQQSFEGGDGEAYSVLGQDPASPVHTHPTPASPGYDNHSSRESSSYDNLDHSLMAQHKGAARTLEFGVGSYRQSSIEDGEDTYNVLSHTTSSVGMADSKSSVDDDNYSTLDRSDTHSSHPPLRKAHSNPTVIPRKCPLAASSHPVPAPRVPRTAEERSSVSSVSSFGSGFCPLDMSGSFTESVCSSSPSQGDLDFYSSIDYATISPSSAAPLAAAPSSAAPSSAQPRNSRTESLNDSPKTSPTKPRKASAPEISIRPTRSKPVKNFVSNLRASLEAEGLDVSKPPAPRRRTTRKVSTENTIPESDTYAEINEDDGNHGDGYLGNRDFRSPSAPLEPTDGIYEEPHMPCEGEASRPKSLQLGKSRTSRKK